MITEVTPLTFGGLQPLVLEVEKTRQNPRHSDVICESFTENEVGPIRVRIKCNFWRTDIYDTKIEWKIRLFRPRYEYRSLYCMCEICREKTESSFNVYRKVIGVCLVVWSFYRNLWESTPIPRNFVCSLVVRVTIMKFTRECTCGTSGDWTETSDHSRFTETPTNTPGTTSSKYRNWPEPTSGGSYVNHQEESIIRHPYFTNGRTFRRVGFTALSRNFRSY